MSDDIPICKLCAHVTSPKNCRSGKNEGKSYWACTSKNCGTGPFRGWVDENRRGVKRSHPSSPESRSPRPRKKVMAQMLAKMSGPEISEVIDTMNKNEERRIIAERPEMERRYKDQCEMLFKMVKKRQ